MRSLKRGNKHGFREREAHESARAAIAKRDAWADDDRRPRRSDGEKAILQEVARRVGQGKLVVSTVASSERDGLVEVYERAFTDLGVKRIHNLEIATREEATQADKIKEVEGAQGFFFTGGDQLKITSQIGDTPIHEELSSIIARGGIVAGTSAGASAMCETMLVSVSGASRIGSMIRSVCRRVWR